MNKQIKTILAASALLFFAGLLPPKVFALLPSCPPDVFCGAPPPEEESTNGGGVSEEDLNGGDQTSGEQSGEGETQGGSQEGLDESGTSGGSSGESGSGTNSGETKDDGESAISGSESESSPGGGGLSGKEDEEALKDSRQVLSPEKIVSLPLMTDSPQCDIIREGVFRIEGDRDGDGLVQIFIEGSGNEAYLQESFYGTDPDNPDTDYDSYFDGEEVCAGYDPLSPPIIDPINWDLVNRLKGYILLQVERHGEAWYMYPEDGFRYYLRNGEIAYQIMRYLSLGITNEDLSKIPVGIEERFQDEDTDGDGLADKLEEGLKTDPLNADTDNDGLTDGEEVSIFETNPLGEGVLHYNQQIIDRVRGRILLQVEERGQAWYVHPETGRRYYMKDGEAAYQIMRYLSLGITNADINTLPIGTLMGIIQKH